MSPPIKQQIIRVMTKNSTAVSQKTDAGFCSITAEKVGEFERLLR